MYKSSYTQATLGLGANRTIKKPRGKSCGYYMRLVFLFSSLIQSLIIVSLVLFLVYGRSPDAAAEGQAAELERSFTRASMDNINLRRQKQNLTLLLNATRAVKTRTDKDLAKTRELLNNSSAAIYSMRSQLIQCDSEKKTCQIETRKPMPFAPTICDCSGQTSPYHRELTILRYNFTHTVEFMRNELESTARDRDTLNLETIVLRRDKKSLQTELESYKTKCKQDFVKSLDGISEVSRAFLLMIDSLVPKISPFKLTCDAQRDYLSNIQRNCTSLSREVETKLQYYLNNVGTRVSEIQSASARLEAQKAQLAEDYSWCSLNRSAMARVHSQTLERNQDRYDREKEKLLLDLKRSRGDAVLKEARINIQAEQIRQYNASLANCASRTSLDKPAVSRTSVNLFTGTPWDNALINSGTGGGGPGGVGAGGAASGRTGSVGVGSGGTGGSAAWGNIAMGGARLSPTGQGTRGPSQTGGLGTSALANGNTGLAGTGPMSARSSGTVFGNTGATQGVNRVPSGTGPVWTGSVGARTNGIGTGASNSYSSANINQLLRELQQYSNPNSGKEVSG